MHLCSRSPSACVRERDATSGVFVNEALVAVFCFHFSALKFTFSLSRIVSPGGCNCPRGARRFSHSDSAACRIWYLNHLSQWFGFTECVWKSVSAHKLRPITEQLSESFFFSFFFYDMVGFSELIILWSRARPGRARPGQARPSQTRPGQARR